MNMPQRGVVALALILTAAAPLRADELTLTSGAVVKAVITSERDTTISATTQLGTVTFERSAIRSITRAPRTDNDALIAGWRKDKERALAERAAGRDNVRFKDGEQLIRYRDTWMKRADYDALVADRAHAQTMRLESERMLFDAEVAARDRDRRRKETRALITQNTSRRSREANIILSTGTWLAERTSRATFYYPDTETSPLAAILVKQFESYFQKIASDLALETTACTPDMITIIIVPASSWNTAAIVTPTADRHVGDAVCSSFYFRELLIAERTPEAAVSSIVTEELARFILRDLITRCGASTHRAPLWLEEGLVHYESSRSDDLLTPLDIADAITKNYYVKLDALLGARTLPDPLRDRLLFITEATSMVDFIITTFGTRAFNQFVLAVAAQDTALFTKSPAPSVERIRRMMVEIMKATAVGKTYAGYASFEEAWMRFMVQKKKEGTGYRIPE